MFCYLLETIQTYKEIVGEFLYPNFDACFVIDKSTTNNSTL